MTHTPATAALNGPVRPGLVSVDGKTFPLQSAEIRARAEGGLAESRLVQVYRNPHDEPLEVLYTLPLPVDGAVVGYTITLGDRVIEGEIQPIAKAREAYRRALEEGRTAGWIEQLRADTFVQRLGNLPKGARPCIDIRVLHRLAFRREARTATPIWEYRFPTVIGVRYHGEPGRIEDRSDLDPDRADAAGTPVRLDLDLRIGDGHVETLAPVSPSHRLACRADGAGCAVGLSEAAPLDRDLVVQWRAAEPSVGLRLVEGGGLPGDPGRYGLLTITPPVCPSATLARDLTILIDASGSMLGERLDLAKSVVHAVLDSLEERDSFEVLAFASSVVELVRGPVSATPAKLRGARKRLEALEAGGGTEMATAVTRALEPLRGGAQRQVLLLTDGWVGFEAQVIRNVRETLQPGCRLHVVGIGSAPNRSLTRGASRAGRGREQLVGERAGLEAAIAHVLSATTHPVLDDIVVTGSACLQATPERCPDVLADQPLVCAIELSDEGGTVEVRGRLAGSAEPWVQQVEIGPRSTASPDATPHATASRTPLPIGALFGRERVADLELELATADPVTGARARIEQPIEALGMKHRVVTRRTSLVAIADEPGGLPDEPRRRRRLEVELPAGVSAAGLGLRRTAVAHMRARPASLALRMVDLRSFYRSWEAPARIVHQADGLWVIEFEAPADGFVLPVARKLLLAQSDWRPLELVAAKSSPSGPHARGTRLRVAMHRKRDTDRLGKTVHLTWWDGPETTLILVLEGQ